MFLENVQGFDYYHYNLEDLNAKCTAFRVRKTIHIHFLYSRVILLHEETRQREPY